MDAKQKKLVIDALQRAFTSSVKGSENLTVHLLSDDQIEMLFGAMVLIATFGPPELEKETSETGSIGTAKWPKGDVQKTWPK